MSSRQGGIAVLILGMGLLVILCFPLWMAQLSLTTPVLAPPTVSMENKDFSKSSVPLFQTLYIGTFSMLQAGSIIPAEWKVLSSANNKRPTEYTLVKDGNTVVVKATSSAQSSGLIRAVSIRPKEYPIIQWRWKVSNVVTKSDVSRKEGDDYAARIFILFPSVIKGESLLGRFRYQALRTLFGQYGLPRAINYVWENHHPKGTMVPGAYFGGRIRMVVVRNSEDPLNRWITEERNYYRDYKDAFGEEPPPLAAVAIMTDTDNTGESVAAYYGDISFKKGSGH